MTATTLKLIAFPGAPNLPIFAAIERGYFEDAGVLVTLETTPSSAYQIESLVNGDFQIAATAFDNVVAYQEQQGAVQLAKEPDLFVVMGATQLELSLVVAPEIQTYEDLRGRSLALDALATGFASCSITCSSMPGLMRGATRRSRSARHRSAGRR